MPISIAKGVSIGAKRIIEAEQSSHMPNRIKKRLISINRIYLL